MAWDYAELSKAAKAAGGPEKLMDLISETSRQEGREEMAPLVVAALAVGAVASWGITKLVDFFKGKKKATPKEIEAAKAEIIQGIKDYDASHECSTGDKQQGDDEYKGGE